MSQPDLDLQKSRREEIRWRILRALEAGRPVAVSEQIICRALNDAALDVTPHEVRRELQFLNDHALVLLEEVHTPVWRARLSASGVNVVEYDAPAPAGVGRPQKWY